MLPIIAVILLMTLMNPGVIVWIRARRQKPVVYHNVQVSFSFQSCAVGNLGMELQAYKHDKLGMEFPLFQASMFGMELQAYQMW